MRFYFMFLLTVFILGCSKNKTENKNKDFVKGDVLVGIDSMQTLEQLFSAFNAFNLTIDQITGYYYTTTIPKDSIPYIKTVLNSKIYIYTRNFSASVWPHYQTQIVHNTTSLWDMTSTNQQDYIQTKNILRMNDILSSTKNMLINVPIGEEIYWKDRLKTFSWVRWTDLNWIGGAELYGR